MTAIQTLAIVYAAGCLGVVGFQIALIAGAPWGRVTQGGRHDGALPRSGRVIALVSIPILGAMAGGVLSAAGLWPHGPEWTGWLALALQALVTLLNLVTPSRPERLLWGPIEVAMLAMAVAVVLGG